MEEKDGWREYQKLVLDKLEKAEDHQAFFVEQLTNFDRTLNNMQTVREARTKDLDYLLDVIRNGNNPVLERLKNLEAKITDIEKIKRERSEHSLWVRTSILAVFAGSIGALWEMLKHFWLK